MRAWDLLDPWISGYRRNSRHRGDGFHYFLDPAEFSEYQELLACHSALRRTGPPQEAPSQEVSSFALCYFVPFPFFTFGLLQIKAFYV